MRVFVTGGNGFIGSRVVAELVDAKHEVVCLLRPHSNVDRIAHLPVGRATGDVRNAGSLRNAMRECDATVHLAGPGGWKRDDRNELRAVVIGGMRNVLGVAAELGEHRVVVVSSTAAVNASDGPCVFDETASFAIDEPRLYYAHAKHAAELVVRDAAMRGVPAVVVNPAEVYGPGDTELSTAANLLNFARSWPVLVCGGGTSVVHVDDVARGIVAALDRGRVGERYILGGENLSIRELAELVLACIGRRAPIVRIPNGVARWTARAAAALRMPFPSNPHVVAYATRYWYMDNRKAQRELGITFRGARETIGDTLAWLQQAKHLGA